MTSFIGKKKLSKILRDFVKQLDAEKSEIGNAIASLETVGKASGGRNSRAVHVGAHIGKAQQHLHRVANKLGKKRFGLSGKEARNDAVVQQLLSIDSNLDKILQDNGNLLRDDVELPVLIAYQRLLATLIVTASPLREDSGPAYLIVQKLRSIVQGFAEVEKSLVVNYSEQPYLEQNRDVMDSVGDAGFSNGFEHFLCFGGKEIESGQRYLSSEQKRKKIKKAAVDDFNSLVIGSGIVDEKWYLQKYAPAIDATEHFIAFGMFEGCKPNYYWDWQWLESSYPQFAGQPDKLVGYYLSTGEKNGIRPSLIFDPIWYASAYGVDLQKNCSLGHFIQTGRVNGYSPNKCVSYSYYVEENPDVLSSGMDPFEHYFECGWREGRRPSIEFDTDFYVGVHLHGYKKINPVSHYLEIGEEKCLPVNASGANDLQLARSAIKDIRAEIPRSVKYFANPGDSFEDSEVVLGDAKPRIRNIAFYLPQFHAFDENDEWWGKGFTEWRNVMRGLPRFEGHYQPRIPRDLGFYDLSNEDALVKQVEIALQNGVAGFCFYYYWFNGKRLMDMPLDLYANSDRIDSEFCIMWANENWTRTWDGMEKNVLIQQDYHLEDEDLFIADTTRYFANPRYITVEGRPLFILYRPGLVSGGNETFERWREKWRHSGFDPILFMVQGFGDNDPKEFGFDGAVEFPPHKLCDQLPNINDELNIYDGDYMGHVVSYDDVVEKSLTMSVPDYPLIKTVVPHWDNDARREGRGFTIHGSTPKKYERWLAGAVDYAIREPIAGSDSSFVFVNAWNEWAEGAYLEPDVHYGHAYLNANRRAVYGTYSAKSQMDILLVGHDAHKHGAQMLLLNIAKIMSGQFGLKVKILLLAGGALEERYREVAEVEVLQGVSALADSTRAVSALDGADILESCESRIAITNTCVTGSVVPDLKAMGFKVVSLIHELPRIIREYGLDENVESIASNSDSVVFPADNVKVGFTSFCSDIVGDSLILPQGSYQEIDYIDGAKEKLCQDLDIPENSKIVLNVGFADLRKGFDIFLQVAKLAADQGKDIHFVWLGGLSPDMDRWIYEDYRDLKNVHCIGFSDDVASYYNACDALFLSSREDPYPTVVLEALCLGKPVVCLAGATGFDSLMAEYGHLVDGSNAQEMVDLLYRTVNTSIDYKTKQRIDYFNEHCRFDDYCWSLLSLLSPALKKVSVVVPNYNYADHMEARIQSIFDQTYPVFELILLDDRSTDNSIDVISSYVEKSGREARLIENEINSGNTFKQWKKGLENCRGDLLWIAEADDLSSPLFLATTVSAFSQGTTMVFTDSAQIDEDGTEISDSYGYYYKHIDENLFSGSFSMPGDEFCRQAMSVKNPILNVSSVVWDTNALSDCLGMAYNDVVSYRVAGDWRLYIDVLLREDSFVSYINQSLNTHRRHQSSVTHSLDYHSHLGEIQSIHKYLGSKISLTRQESASMDEYIDELVEQFGIRDAA